MGEIVNMIADTGALIILAGLFVYSWLMDRNKTTNTLESLEKSNNNIEMLQKMMNEDSSNKCTKLDDLNAKLDEIITKLDKPS